AAVCIRMRFSVALESSFRKLAWVKPSCTRFCPLSPWDSSSMQSNGVEPSKGSQHYQRTKNKSRLPCKC
ncbi:mCG126341, partial [Mus musculus]